MNCSCSKSCSHTYTHGIKLIMQHRWEIPSNTAEKSCNISSKLFWQWICWAPSSTASNMALSIPPKLAGVQSDWDWVAFGSGGSSSAWWNCGSSNIQKRRMKREKYFLQTQRSQSTCMCLLSLCWCHFWWVWSAGRASTLLLSGCFSTANYPGESSSASTHCAGEGTVPVEWPQESMGQSEEQFDGTMWEGYGSGCLWHCYENE